MICKHLLHYTPASNTWSVFSCSAEKTPYVPSLVELERFCQTNRHAICPKLFSFGAVFLKTNRPALAERPALEQVW